MHIVGWTPQHIVLMTMCEVLVLWLTACVVFDAAAVQVVLDKPAALAQNMMGVDGYSHLQVRGIRKGRW